MTTPGIEKWNADLAERLSKGNLRSAMDYAKTLCAKEEDTSVSNAASEVVSALDKLITLMEKEDEQSQRV